MDWKKNRILIALLALAALVGASVWASMRRERQTAPESTDFSAKFPALSADKLETLEITRAGGTAVRLAKTQGVWRVVAPVEAAVDQSAVDGAIGKLTQLKVTAIAAESPSSHAKLEVDAAHGVLVKAQGKAGASLEVIIGAYRSGGTMLRLPTAPTVYQAQGSIRYAFDKELKDWRDRDILEVDAKKIKGLRFERPGFSFHFKRQGEAWVVESAKPSIKDFSPSEVDSIVGTLAHLSATDFAASKASTDDTGLADDSTRLGDESPRLSLEIESDTSAPSDKADAGPAAPAAAAPSQTVVLRLGKKAADGQSYLQKQGSDVIYLIAAYAADRLLPTAETFKKKPEAAAPKEAPEPPPSLDGLGAGGAGGQIPPEVMEKLRQQMGQ